MPLFAIANGSLVPIQQLEFEREKDLQSLVEASLQPIFNCRLIQSEFSTGVQHAGRIDTLALSEDDNPVIIEYKKTESSELINQSLFYLHWLRDHRGDFHVAAQRALGGDVEVEWSDVPGSSASLRTTASMTCMQCRSWGRISNFGRIGGSGTTRSTLRRSFESPFPQQPRTRERRIP